MGPTLSEEKTRITKLRVGFLFMGCRASHKWDDRFGLWCRVKIPMELVNDFRWRVKKLLRRQTQVQSLKFMLREAQKDTPYGTDLRNAGAVATDQPRCPPCGSTQNRGRPATITGRLHGSGPVKAPVPSHRVRLREMLADLKKPAAIETVDGFLFDADTIAALKAVERLLDGQEPLRPTGGHALV